MRICVLVHRHIPLDARRYYMRELAAAWREHGHEVVVARGPEEAVDADLAVLHVDLTVVPPDHLEVLGRYPRVINGAVTDISKRRVSRLRLLPGDAWNGPVIVKANLNYGGVEEARLAERGLLPESFRTWVRDYAILDSAADVTPEVWAHPGLIVERFVPEFEDGHFRLRLWKFCGDRGTNTLTFSPEPIVKGRSVTRREELGEVPEELRRIRAELGFDFGKFDYGIVDGRVVLYDANRTPCFMSTPERERPRIRLLAEGLNSFRPG